MTPAMPGSIACRVAMGCPISMPPCPCRRAPRPAKHKACDGTERCDALALSAPNASHARSRPCVLQHRTTDPETDLLPGEVVGQVKCCGRLLASSVGASDVTRMSVAEHHALG